MNQSNQLNKIRSQIADLVNQYAEIAFAKSSFIPGETIIPHLEN